ncbi:unnamed protein product [Strongylus vulgaris]|uniref:Uncharacterized protein n=1 Tax=Strongylus vulgaris TaxID=40348 RepID=A0A3P7J523_STRVU|nr:unnamed protein product [Strongylus vulgaris]
MGYPYPISAQPVPFPQHQPIYQFYPSGPPMYAPTPMPYPPQPGMPTPGYMPQGSYLPQSAPNAPTAPPVDLNDIQPEVVTSRMKNMHLRR